MKSLGRHLIIEFYDCNPDILNNAEDCERIILEAVRISGATAIRPFFHHFSPHGVSGMVVIAESHFSLHTWPEYGYAAIDIFTCGDGIDAETAIAYLKKYFSAGHYSVVEIKRGLLDSPGSEIKYKPDVKSRLKIIP